MPRTEAKVAVNASQLIRADRWHGSMISPVPGEPSLGAAGPPSGPAGSP